MKLGLCQMPVTASQQENHAAMRRYVRDAAAAGCDLVVLPEMWCCPYDNAAFADYADPQGGRTWRLLRDTARESGVWLVAGSVPERDGDAIYNTCYVFDPNGTQRAKHRKVHLFDIDVADSGFSNPTHSRPDSTIRSLTRHSARLVSPSALTCALQSCFASLPLRARG